VLGGAAAAALGVRAGWRGALDRGEDLQAGRLGRAAAAAVEAHAVALAGQAAGDDDARAAVAGEAVALVAERLDGELDLAGAPAWPTLRGQRG
jgi:hypothetical protein